MYILITTLQTYYCTAAQKKERANLVQAGPINKNKFYSSL